MDFSFYVQEMNGSALLLKQPNGLGISGGASFAPAPFFTFSLTAIYAS
jgi:hypothetical protein